MVPPRNGVSSPRSIEPRAAEFRLSPPGATNARELPVAPSQVSETVSMPRGGRHTGAPTPRTSSPSSTTRSPPGPHTERAGVPNPDQAPQPAPVGVGRPGPAAGHERHRGGGGGGAGARAAVRGRPRGPGPGGGAGTARAG